MAPASPTVARWELGLRLRAHREASDHHVATAAKAVGTGQSFLSGVEAGKTKVGEERLTMLCALYDLDEDETRDLTRLREQANERPWWSRYSGLFGADMLRFFGFEHGADTIRAYSGGLVNGLLQTEDYARAVINSAVPNIRLAETERRLEARMIRQRRLTGEDPPHLTAVMNEAALRQQVGGREVLREQVRHLLDRAEEYEQALDLRIVPFTAGAYDALDGSSFYIFTFPSAQLPTLGWQETVTSTALIEDEMQIREYTVAYNQAAEAALSRAESLKLLRGIVKELT